MSEEKLFHKIPLNIFNKVVLICAIVILIAFFSPFAIPYGQGVDSKEAQSFVWIWVLWNIHFFIYTFICKFSFNAS